MANALAVGGMKKLLNKMNEEVIEAANKAAKRDGETFETVGKVHVRGNFGFDKEGDFGIVGNVLSKSPAGEASMDFGDGWQSHGNGTLELEFSVRVSRTPTQEE